jgi:hypothetical protein
LDSPDSSGPSFESRATLRAAAEGAAVGALGAAAAAAIFRGAELRAGIAWGVGTAWLASSASVAWLLWGLGRSTKAFWYAFGGGMALRAAALAALMAWSWRRTDVSVDALLLSYVFGVLALLLTMEIRYLKPR